MSRRADIFADVDSRAKEESAKAEAIRAGKRSAPLDAPADFRGRWEFDQAASQYGRLPKPKTVDFTITQAANDLVTDITVDGRQQISTYTLDGVVSVNAMGANAKALGVGLMRSLDR